MHLVKLGTLQRICVKPTGAARIYIGDLVFLWNINGLTCFFLSISYLKVIIDIPLMLDVILKFSWQSLSSNLSNIATTSPYALTIIIIQES